LKSDFEIALLERGFRYNLDPDGYYNIIPKNRIVLPTKVQLVASRQINQFIQGSQNGNELDGIGYFIFDLRSEHTPDYFVFIFKNLKNESAQFMIIPAQELRRRIKKNMIRYRSGEHIELRLWLMDGHLYDTTGFGLEAEWYYLSESRGCRMIDVTIWNYSHYLNRWILVSPE